MAVPTPITKKEVKQSVPWIYSAGTLPVQWYSADGSNGNSFINITNKCLILVKNESASEDVVCTIATTFVNGGFSLADLAAAIDHGEEAIIGPFSSIFEGTSKTVIMTWTGVVTDVSVAVINLTSE
jgi:hypothetical protein